MYDVERRMAMEPIQGKWASSRIDLGYTELLCVPEVTSVFFSSCDCVLGDSLEFYQQIEAPYVFVWEHRIALHAMQGNWASSRSKREVSWVSSSCNRNLGYIHMLWRGWPFETLLC